MKSIVDILKQFSQQQRLLVLGLLLITILLMSYFKQDDCSSLMEENLKMHSDFVTISQMLREERLGNLKVESSPVQLDTFVIYNPPTIIDETPSTMDKILTIAESNIDNE